MNSDPLRTWLRTLRTWLRTKFLSEGFDELRPFQNLVKNFKNLDKNFTDEDKLQFDMLFEQSKQLFPNG